MSMEDYTGRPFGSRPIRCEMLVGGQRVVKWLTPRQMGMSEQAIAEMESMEDDAEVERQTKLRKAS